MSLAQRPKTLSPGFYTLLVAPLILLRVGSWGQVNGEGASSSAVRSSLRVYF